MRALVIAPQPFFTPRGTPFSVYYRTLVTAQHGVQIDLLTYGEGQDVDIPGVRIHRVPRFRALGSVRVGPSPLKLFLDGFVLLGTVWLLLRNRYDFVHAHEESVFFCRWLKPIFGFKLVYDMHSSLPQQLINFKFSRSPWLIRLFERLEDGSLANADAVITICPELAEYAVPRLPDPSRHVLIENSMFEDVQLTVSSSATPSNGQVPLPPERPVVLYAGTFEPYQGLDILIRAVAQARRSRPDIFLLMVGGSAEQVAQYRARAAAAGLEHHSLFTGRIPQAQVKGYAQHASVLTSPRIEGTNTPLKIYEQLSSGIPLVATRILSHTQVLSDETCFLVEPDPDDMARGILAALEDPARRDRVVSNAKALYEREYSRPAYEKKIRQLLDLVR